MEPFQLDGSQDKTLDGSLDEAIVLRLVPWRRFPHLSAGFSTRQGGVSDGVFASLNCGLHVADDQEAVIENRARVAMKAGFSLEDWINAEQVHGNLVTKVTRDDRGRGNIEHADAIPATDALITAVSGLMLVAFFADCVPLYFYDPEHEAIGLAHAGWKGTVQQIALHTIAAMQAEFGTRINKLCVAIGPSIGACCYEVDSHVIEQIQSITEDEAAYQRLKEDQYRLDLKLLNRHLMIEAGVLPTNIECTTRCTGCDSELFFSYRKEKGQTGRMAAWVGMIRR